MEKIAENQRNPQPQKQRNHLPKAGGSEKKLGMGIEPTKIGYLLARVKPAIGGDVSSQQSFFAASSPLSLFHNLKE